MAIKTVPQLEEGQHVFGEHGECYAYDAPAGNGHLVRPLINYDGEESLGPPRYIEKVFLAPPVQVYADAALRLRSEIAELEQRRTELEAEVAIAESGARDLKKRLKQHAALRYIDDILEGRITHFVMECPYRGVALKTADEALASREERYEKKHKLLTLYGATAGDLQWRLNQYSDGSGTNETVHPFPSEEAAAAFARNLLAEKLSEYLADLPKLQESWLASAKALGVPIPAAVMQHQIKKQREKLERTARERRQLLAESEAALAALPPEPTGEEG